MKRTPPSDSEKPSASIITFKPKAELDPEQNRAEFIRMAREDLKVFGSDLDWDHWWWPGICKFVKLDAKNGTHATKAEPEILLDPAFMDFAKACMRYQGGRYPESTMNRRSVALRAVEATLLQMHKSANPSGIDIPVLNRAAQFIRDRLCIKAAHNTGRNLEHLAELISSLKLIPNDVSLWRSPIGAPKNLNKGIGREADEDRKKKLPPPEALDALANIFAKGWNPGALTDPRDIYTTSVAAILLAAPARISETLSLHVDVMCKDKDSSGDTHHGMRYRAGKGFGPQIKWVPEVWVDIANEAVRRIRELTEESRKLASYIERQLETRKINPDAPLRFYPHAKCPKVPGDRPLTTKEVREAMGFQSNMVIYQHHIKRVDGVYTLNNLWAWVLNNLPKHFPYINKKKIVKFSQALFCMQRNMLHPVSTTSPVTLYMPLRSTFNEQLVGSKDRASIFERYGCLDAKGRLLRMTSHMFRHFLNTLAHAGTADIFVSQVQIDIWSGRKTLGDVYDHVPAEDRAERAREVVESDPMGEPAPTDSGDVSLRNPPKSTPDLVRGCSHSTLYGTCEHDFLWSPCGKLADCLVCEEHYCIKDLGEDGQKKLERIKGQCEIHAKAEADAKQQIENGVIGAEDWYEDQKTRREILGGLVSILENPETPDGSIIRIANPTARTHEFRVLRAAVLDAYKNNLDDKETVLYLAAIRKNLPLPLRLETAQQLELPEGENDGEKPGI